MLKSSVTNLQPVAMRPLASSLLASFCVVEGRARLRWTIWLLAMVGFLRGDFSFGDRHTADGMKVEDLSDGAEAESDADICGDGTAYIPD
jgi:hypothetical protein